MNFILFDDLTKFDTFDKMSLFQFVSSGNYIPTKLRENKLTFFTESILDKKKKVEFNFTKNN